MTIIVLTNRDTRIPDKSPEPEGPALNLEVHGNAVALVRALHLATRPLTVILPADDEQLCADIQRLVAADPEALGRHRFVSHDA